ncbi:MAG: hypothetical protein ACE15B_05435 [Bryobacteraceae bacterium]
MKTALAVLFAAGAAALHAASPFTMNGWQFHEYDIPKLEEAIRKAPDYGVNFFIFSHRLFRSVEGFLASNSSLDPKSPPAHLARLYRKSTSHTKPHPYWQRDLLRVAAAADRVRIPYYLWIHEFDDIPDPFLVKNRVNFDDPKLFPYLEQRYERLLAAVPGTAGFVLTFHESDHKPFRNSEVASKLDASERMYRLSMLIYNIAKKHGKQLIVRNFFYEPLEMQFMKAAIGRLPDDIIVMSKDTVHEFHPFYPSDPLHGDVGRKKQIIEFDLGVEKAWSTQGAYAQTEYIQRYARRAQSLKLAGMVGRARLMWDKPFEDSHEVNLYAFSRFMENPGLGVEQVLREWAARRYPEEAVPYIASAMARTQFINHNGRYHLENWFTKSIGSEWGDYNYYFGHPLERSRYKWSRNPADQELENKLFHPDRAVFDRAVAEKDEVIRQVLASTKDVEEAARYMAPEKIAPLKEDFRFLLDAARLQREWVRAYFAQRMFIEQQKEESRVIAEDALRKLESLERTPGVTYGLDPETGRRYNIDNFVLEMRWRMANIKRARLEDERILERARSAGDVERR